MDTSFGIQIPPWSYASGGEAWLDRVAGEVGLDHVTATAVSGPTTELRLGIAGEAPYFDTEGGWHYPHNAKLYASTTLKPARARWVGGGDALGRLCAHVRRLGLRYVLRLDLRAVPALVEHAPHVGQRNAWGQEVPSAGPCACHPEVRELLRGTLADLERWEPNGFLMRPMSNDHDPMAFY